MTRKIVGWGLLLVAAGALVFAWSRAPKASSGASGKLHVTASFYPMGEFARQVGRDRAEVSVLVQPGVEPHDFDPTPRQIAGLYQSKLVVYNGAGLEPWADKLASDLRGQGTVVVGASSGLASGDPHVWLDPALASREVEAIKLGYIAADPAGRAEYEAAATVYQQKLADLDRDFTAGLAQCSRHEIVTSHQAFKYLAARYHFTALGIAGLAPDEEPSPQKLAEVAQFVKDHAVPYIFFETLTSPKLTQTIAQETGAQTLVFNPLEGLTTAEVSEGQNYLTVQHQNLVNLRIALDCK